MNITKYVKRKRGCNLTSVKRRFERDNTERVPSGGDSFLSWGEQGFFSFKRFAGLNRPAAVGGCLSSVLCVLRGGVSLFGNSESVKL